MQTTVARCLMEGNLPIQIWLPSNRDRQSTSCSRAVNREQSRDTFNGPTSRLASCQGGSKKDAWRRLPKSQNADTILRTQII